MLKGRYAGLTGLVVITTLSLVMHLRVFPLDLIGQHVWKQTETVTIAQNFARTGMDILHPQQNYLIYPDGVLRKEFPLPQWINGWLFQTFSEQIAVSRIYYWLLHILSLIGIYFLGWVLLKNTWQALALSWCFSLSPLLFYYGINPIPDNMSLLLGIWGWVFWLNYERGKRIWLWYLACSLLGVAALIKLPFILLFMPLAVSALLQLKKDGFMTFTKLSLPALVFVFPVALWYINVIPTWTNNPVVNAVWSSEKVTLAWFLDVVITNLISTLPEWLLGYPAMAFFLVAVVSFFKRKWYDHKLFIPLASIAVILLAFYFYELPATDKHHDYYFFPYLPLLFVILASGIKVLFKKNRYIAIVILLILPITTFLRTQRSWNENDPKLDVTIHAHHDRLTEMCPKGSKVLVGNDETVTVWFYYLNKKGWAFYNDDITSAELDNIVEKGCKCLYSNSRLMEDRPHVKEHLGKQLGEVNGIKVFELK